MQVLLNLSANAVKFTDKGKVTVDINLVKICNEWVNLRFPITDTGIGISQKNIPHLFESFKQADSATTRRFGGSGLGLTVSQEIVKLMGSEINVSSQLGKGSCFQFEISLPIDYEFVVNDRELEPFSNALDILVVDDNPVSLQVIKQALESMGARVNAFINPKEAMRPFSQNVPDVVIIDWKMPGIDGVTYFKRLKRFKLPKRVLKLLTTSYNTDNHEDEIFAAGIDDIVRKPMDFSNLRELIENKTNAGCKQSSTETSLVGKTILLVEDNEINQEVSEFILSQLGLIVKIANNGKEAVDAMQNGAYDFILMDIQMPVMDGIEATQKIRKELKLNTPIIAHTANVLTDDIDTYLNVGMNAHVAKPVDKTDIERALKRFL